MLKKLAMIFAFALLATPSFAAETAYFSAMNDLPMMQGMVEQPADTVIFDKPAGRIVEFSATTATPEKDVLGFYDRCLPPLGWKEIKKGVFVRAHEKLKMSFGRSAGETLVDFSVTPDD